MRFLSINHLCLSLGLAGSLTVAVVVLRPSSPASVISTASLVAPSNPNTASRGNAHGAVQLAQVGAGQAGASLRVPAGPVGNGTPTGSTSAGISAGSTSFQLSAVPPSSNLRQLPKSLKVGLLATGTAGVPISAEVLAHPNVAGFLIHQGWRNIETAKGVFDWAYIDQEFASAVANNKKTKPALHIGGDDAPKWLYDDGTIQFVLGKNGATFTHIGQLTFSGNQVSVSPASWPGNLASGKIIEITGTPNNDGRYRITSDSTSSFTVEEQFTNETNVSGTVSIDVVPCYWDLAVIQHKSDFYNALIAHVQTLGPAALNAMLNVPISMVDPNTGDWAFASTPAHTVSYNAAGWLTGNNAEKQAGWDMFDAAMRLLYDNVLPNVPSTMLVGSAVGPVPNSLLPTGTDNDQPALDILAYVEAGYPGKLNIGKGALNANTYYQNPCPAIGRPWEAICAMPHQNFLQINWSVSAPSKAVIATS